MGAADRLGYRLRLGTKGAQQPFPKQFKNETIHLLSGSCTPLELYATRDGARLAHASAFFWRARGAVWLVTARHNFTGKDNFTGEWLSQSLEPRDIKVHPAVKRDDGMMGLHNTLDMPIVADDGSRLWFEDPQYAELATDIACINLPGTISESIVCLNDDTTYELSTDPGDQCFVLGFPSAGYAEPYAPIWRRATIAMDGVVAIDDKPMFLLDCSSSKAMSGAPVLRREKSFARKEGSNTNFYPEPVWSSEFVGVYGGRIASVRDGERDPLGEIAYAFYANRVSRIIDAANLPIEMSEIPGDVVSYALPSVGDPNGTS